MAFSRHNEVIFSGKAGELWFGSRALNQGSMDVQKGMVVRLNDGTLSQLSFKMEAAPNGTNQMKVLGVAANTVARSVDDVFYGFIAFGGYVTDLPVHGTVAVDDWLRMANSGGLPGYAQVCNTVGQGKIFAIAKSAHTFATHGTVKALVMPWRL